MSIPKLTNDLAIIQKLSDLPNSTEGLTADQLKAKFDEAAETIKAWINETFIPAIKAKNIPFVSTHEINADNVDEAIHAVYEQIQNAATGSIVNGSVTKEKLAESLLDRVFGGRVWVSFDNPTLSENPDTEFPVGQMWLRPANTVYNLESGDWLTSGCTADKRGHSLRLTGNRTVSTINATQTISGIGQAGDRVYVVLDIAERDSELTALTGSFDGGEAFELVGNGVYGMNLTGTTLTIRISAQWPAASLADGVVVLDNITVINPDALLRKYPGTHDRKDWKSWLREAVPFDRVDLTREMYVQTQPGVWQLFDQEVYPVARGGTGLAEIGDGELLYGKESGLARLERPAEPSFLQFENGNPFWAAMNAMAEHGYARIAAGSYVGTGTSNPIVLPVVPKLLIINTPGKTTSTYSINAQHAAVLQQGASQAQNPGGNSDPYVAGVQLDGNTITPYVSYNLSTGERFPIAWNSNGVTYPWFAIY